MKTMLVFGATGGIGKSITPLLRERYKVIPLGSKDIDITNYNALAHYLSLFDFDIVLNLSGIKQDCFVTNLSPDEYMDTIAVNIIGNINVVSLSLPYLIFRRWGRIISVSSIFSEMNVKKNAVYGASKAFVDRFISTANKESASFGVTCNSIQLGYWEGGMADRVTDEIKERMREKTGLHRFGNPDELFNTINYIVDNEYVCGTNLRIDGGVI